VYCRVTTKKFYENKFSEIKSQILSLKNPVEKVLEIKSLWKKDLPF